MQVLDHAKKLIGIDDGSKVQRRSKQTNTSAKNYFVGMVRGTGRRDVLVLSLINLVAAIGRLCCVHCNRRFTFIWQFISVRLHLNYDALSSKLIVENCIRLVELLKGDPVPFALMYTLGNIVAICSTCFLYGPWAQVNLNPSFPTSLVLLTYRNIWCGDRQKKWPPQQELWLRQYTLL